MESDLRCFVVIDVISQRDVDVFKFDHPDGEEHNYYNNFNNSDSASSSSENGQQSDDEFPNDADDSSADDSTDDDSDNDDEYNDDTKRRTSAKSRARHTLFICSNQANGNKVDVALWMK